MDPISPGLPATKPPDDPEQWSDEQWLAWLSETDAGSVTEPPAVGPPRSRSQGSQMLYAAMFGLHQAIYGQVDQITIVEEADGQPDRPKSLDVHLEPEHPEESTVVVRPWLMDGRDG